MNPSDEAGSGGSARHGADHSGRGIFQSLCAGAPCSLPTTRRAQGFPRFAILLSRDATERPASAALNVNHRGATPAPPPFHGRLHVQLLVGAGELAPSRSPMTPALPISAGRAHSPPRANRVRGWSMVIGSERSAGRWRGRRRGRPRQTPSPGRRHPNARRVSCEAHPCGCGRCRRPPGSVPVSTGRLRPRSESGCGGRPGFRTTECPGCTRAGTVPPFGRCSPGRCRAGRSRRGCYG